MQRIILTAVVAVFMFTWCSGVEPGGMVTQVKVISDKVPDVTTLEDWKRSFIREGMTDEEKGLALWRTMSMFQHQDASVMEYLHNEDTLTDAMKVIHVYGHSYCGMVAAHVISLARYIGMEARGWTVTHHVVCEVKWDGAWHLLDSSLLCYFPKKDGSLASIEELVKATQDWYAANPGFTEATKDGKQAGIDAKLRAFHAANGWQGWKKGPEIYTLCPQFSDSGWFPAKTHGWYSVMECYDGSTLFPYDMGFSQGFQVNVQLRTGERITRNWGHKGLCMENRPGCIDMKADEGSLAYSSQMFGDLSNGRIGNGTHEYNVPLKTGAFRKGALLADNLASTARDRQKPAVHVADPNRDGVLVIRMPSSYVYLTGTLELTPVVGTGGRVTVAFSDNNGLDWKDVGSYTASGPQSIDLKALVYRRYDYRLKFVMSGKGTGLDALRIFHDFQHSQRPLPALGAGANTITFSAGTEATISVEGSHNASAVGKQVMIGDFHPVLDNVSIDGSIRVVNPGKGALTFPVDTPGDIVRVRFGLSGRVHDKRDAWHLQVSYDNGATFKTIDTLQGPARFASKYVTASGVPAGTRRVLVRYSGDNAYGGTMIFNQRVDVDYIEPAAGFAPVKITYTWTENGVEKKDEHIASKPQETYTITCAVKPVMQGYTVELAE